MYAAIQNTAAAATAPSSPDGWVTKDAVHSAFAAWLKAVVIPHVGQGIPI